MRNTNITGRILQIKQLVTSTLVYRFSLVPTPTQNMLNTIQKAFYRHVWDGRQRLRHEMMIQPTSKGGFGMIDVHIQNKCLKFSWFSRLFGDTVVFQFWAIHLFSCFTIPFHEVLVCNIKGHVFKLLLCRGAKLPRFWDDVLRLWWFKTFYIDIKITNMDLIGCLKSIPVVFNSAIEGSFADHCLYEFLSENGVNSLSAFVANYGSIFTLCQDMPAVSVARLQYLHQNIPPQWLTLLTNHPIIPPACPVVTRCLAELCSAKQFREIITPKVTNQKAIAHWKIDLDCDIEGFLWNKICARTKTLFTSSLRDFHVQFINRSFQYSALIASYNVNWDPRCSFCSNYPETYLHLFWECDYVFPLWSAIQQFCDDCVNYEDFSTFKCLLSNFTSPLVNVISVIVKKHIHECQCFHNTPSVSQCLRQIKSYRDIHYKICRSCRNVNYYLKFWDVLHQDIVLEEEIAKWTLLENT